MELDKKTTRKIAGLLVFAIVLYFGFNYWQGTIGILKRGYKLLLPFILGGCIAFVLNIPMTFFEEKLWNIKGKGIAAIIKKRTKIISLVLSYIIIAGILVLVSYIVIPQIIDTAKILPQTFENSMLALRKWIESKSWLSSDVAYWISRAEINWNSILNNVKSTAFSGVSSMILSTIGAATTFANGILNFTLGFIFSVYILLQKEQLGCQCKKILYAFFPTEKADSVIEVTALTSQTFSNFITGQCMEAAIIGIMFFVTMVIFRFPYALVISILIAFASLIPVLGSFIGCAVGAFLIVMVNPVKAGLFLIVFLVLQQIEGNVVYPRVVGNSVGLPSIWVLAAITLGGNMMGIAGMIIFIPLFSVVYALLRREVYSRLKKKKLEIE